VQRYDTSQFFRWRMRSGLPSVRLSAEIWLQVAKAKKVSEQMAYHILQQRTASECAQ
jgi:hypothetical protein